MIFYDFLNFHIYDFVNFASNNKKRRGIFLGFVLHTDTYFTLHASRGGGVGSVYLGGFTVHI